MKRSRLGHLTIFAAATALWLGMVLSLGQAQANRIFRAQEPSRPAASSKDPFVNLDVLVTDEDGLVFGGLKRENFRVLDNGKPQTVNQFEPDRCADNNRDADGIQRHRLRLLRV